MPLVHGKKCNTVQPATEIANARAVSICSEAARTERTRPTMQCLLFFGVRQSRGPNDRRTASANKLQLTLPPTCANSRALLSSSFRTKSWSICLVSNRHSSSNTFPLPVLVSFLIIDEYNLCEVFNPFLRFGRYLCHFHGLFIFIPSLAASELLPSTHMLIPAFEDLLLSVLPATCGWSSPFSAP